VPIDKKKWARRTGCTQQQVINKTACVIRKSAKRVLRHPFYFAPTGMAQNLPPLKQHFRTNNFAL
jgi:hypothetical protein